MSINKQEIERVRDEYRMNSVTRAKRTAPSDVVVHGVRGTGPKFESGDWEANHKAANEWCRRNSDKNWAFHVLHSHYQTEAFTAGVYLGGWDK